MSSTRNSTAIVLSLAALTTRALPAAPPDPATFSIAAADPATGEVGVAVASRFFAVGTVVPWAKAGVGAVATQASANTSFGPNGLDLMARGATAEEALKWQEQATTRAEAQPAMLPEVVYDHAVIRFAAGDEPGALSAARRALKLNPKLAAQAASDPDLEAIRAQLP